MGWGEMSILVKEPDWMNHFSILLRVLWSYLVFSTPSKWTCVVRSKLVLVWKFKSIAENKKKKFSLASVLMEMGNVKTQISRSIPLRLWQTIPCSIQIINFPLNLVVWSYVCNNQFCQDLTVWWMFQFLWKGESHAVWKTCSYTMHL